MPGYQLRSRDKHRPDGAASSKLNGGYNTRSRVKATSDPDPAGSTASLVPDAAGNASSGSFSVVIEASERNQSRVTRSTGGIKWDADLSPSGFAAVEHDKSLSPGLPKFHHDWVTRSMAKTKQEANLVPDPSLGGFAVAEPDSSSSLDTQHPTNSDSLLSDAASPSSIKREDTDEKPEDSKPIPRKRARVARAFGASPWPEHEHPTPEECAEVNRLLTEAHGPSMRPEKLVVDNEVSGCGEVPCVLDALCRTILSLNTTTFNSGRAFQGLIDHFGLTPKEDESTESPLKKRRYAVGGAGSVNWNAVRLGDVKELEGSIKFGGLQVKKAEHIKGILDQVWEEGRKRHQKQRRDEALDRIAARRAAPISPDDSGSELSDIEDGADDGELTLDYLHNYDNVALMKKFTSFKGIGYKAASCVMLFSLGRDVFPVDTHVHRLAKFLGWVPECADEVSAFFHLDVKIPNDLKYSLHNLLIRHGRSCENCKGGPESSPKKPKKEPKPQLDEDGNSIKVKRHRSIWVGNGLMKEIRVEVGTDEEDVEEACCIEHLVNRIRKPRKPSTGKKVKKEEGEGEGEDEDEGK